MNTKTTHNTGKNHNAQQMRATALVSRRQALRGLAALGLTTGLSGLNSGYGVYGYSSDNLGVPVAERGEDRR
jgi:hypothetical protein